MQVSIGLAKPFSSSGTARSDLFIQNGAAPVMFATRASETGTVQVFRVDLAGNSWALGSAAAVTSATEDQQVFLIPFGQAFALYTNTSAASGTVSFEAIAADRGLTG